MRISDWSSDVCSSDLSGTAGGQVTEDFKINGQYVDTPDQGVVGIPYFDGYVERAALEFLEEAAQSDTPFYINVNFMKVHQPNMPAPEFEHKSRSTRSEEQTTELQSLMRTSSAGY